MFDINKHFINEIIDTKISEVYNYGFDYQELSIRILNYQPR